ncbi:MAG: VanZ family protein [Candidatus Komeilibacteria bacterium]
MKHKLIHFIKYGAFTILWMVFIFFLSAQSRLDIGLEDLWDVLFKKAAHIFVYTVLGLLITKLLYGYRHWSHQEGRINVILIVFLSFLVGLVFALSDEYHQTLVPGRNGNVIDVYIDSLGLLLGVVWGYRLHLDRLRHGLKVLFSK